MLRKITQSELIEYAGVLVVLFVVFPLVLDNFRLSLVAKYLAFAFVAIGIVLSWGYGGMLSLGQGIFFGLGGYMMAMFLKLEASGKELPDFMVWSSTEELPWWWQPFHSFPATLLAILVLPALLAFILSYAVFKKRVSGVYFAIITMALALTLTVLLVGQQGYTGGANGITDFRTLLGASIISERGRTVLYFAESALLLLVMAATIFIIKSRLGKILIAVRDREDRVRFSGYDTAMVKAFAFSTGALFSALGGAMYSLQVGLITPTLVGAAASVEMVIYAAVGGRLSVVGAVYGALLVGWTKSLFSENFPTLWLFFMGGLFIFVVMAMPDGLAGVVGQLSIRRKKPAATKPAAEPKKQVKA
ncbi:MAG: putative high-affinity branched-chain amino acid transporter, permease protein [Herminiimonas sp.]|jgi:urea transport system permease protein|nr:putative high-affinity branched-chain amino acid transporter, permease protein [Herminiimonas sp.]